MKTNGQGWLMTGAVGVALALGAAGWVMADWLGGQSGHTEVWLQTGWLRVWTAWLGGAAALAWGVWMAWGRRKEEGRGGRLARLGFWVLAGAWLLRFATADMALDSMVRPDGVHFATGADQLVERGKLCAPTRGTDLPLRTLPGPSVLFAATQWMNPGHLGAGVLAVWICSGLMIWAAWGLGRRFGGAAGGWWAALLTGLSPALGWYSRQVMSEVPWGLLVLVSTGWLALAWEGRKGWLAAVAGLLAGAGMSVKSSHLLVVIGLFAALCWTWWSERAARREGRGGGGWGVWLGFAAGVAAGAAPALLYNRAALGGWLSTAYHVYWPGWASATTALNVKYLFSPPLIQPTLGLGNVPYYALTLLGGEVRPERLILLPGALIAAGWALWAGRRRGGGAPRGGAEGAAGMFGRAAVCGGGLYLAGCLLYSFQEPRFLLPVVPLIFVAWARRLGAASERMGLGGRRWLEGLGWAAVAGEAALGGAILLAEAGIPAGRTPERAVQARLGELAGAYDVLVSDEDPLLLTRALGGRAEFLPMLLPGELWFASDPGKMGALMEERHVAVEPFDGTVPLVWKALGEGKRVAAYIRKPSAREEAWRQLNTAFELREEAGAGLPRTFWRVEARGAFPLGTDLSAEAAWAAGAEDGGMPAFSALNRARPAHDVTLSPHELGRRETSNGEFAEFLGTADGVETRRTERGFEARLGEAVLAQVDVEAEDCGLELGEDGRVRARTGKEELPAVFVTWRGAVEYCNWRSRREGLTEVYAADADGGVRWVGGDGWRLPTEAEWECTAGWDGATKRTYEWGEEYGAGPANLAGRGRGEDGYLRTGVETGNRMGCEELTGNVWEWCWDWYADYAGGEETDPRGPEKGEMRVLRGGSWRSMQGVAYAAYRGLAAPETATDDIGFRVARDLWRLP